MTATASSRWISGYRVYSELVLPPAAAPLVYRDAKNSYEIQIRNANEDPDDDAGLILHVILEAPDIETANAHCRDQADSFLRLLTFVTSNAFKVVRQLFVLDWTPGVVERHGYAYSPPGKHQPFAVNFEQLVSTLQMFEEWSDNEVSSAALRWYSIGVRNRVWAEQFQYFWFVFELIAESSSSNEKVPDLCATHRTELYCKECDGPSMHKPFRAQKIKTLMSNVGATEEGQTIIVDVRNMLLHGKSDEKIDAYLKKVNADLTLGSVVDSLARLAKFALMQTLELPGGNSFDALLLDIDSFAKQVMTIRGEIVTTLPGDHDNPKVEDIQIQLPKVEIIFENVELPADAENAVLKPVFAKIGKRASAP